MKISNLACPLFLMGSLISALPSPSPTGLSPAQITALSAELTGPEADLVACIAVKVAGLALIFGDDIGKFARTLLMIVIAIDLDLGLPW